MKLILFISALLAGLDGRAAAQPSEFAAGRASYMAGDFKRAAAHFQLALKSNPNDAEACYWLGMSYQVLADIAAPLGRASNAKARVYLTKAVELAPGRPEYRRELFSFLLGSSGSSRAARRQAAGILRTASESDPDFQDMRLRFEQERKANAFAAARLGRLFLVIPRATYRVTELPASAFASRGGSEPATPER